MSTAMLAADPSRRSPALGYLAAIGLVIAATVVAALFKRIFPTFDPALVFLTAVLLSAVAGGLGASILCSLASVLAFDFYFVEPLHTLSVSQPEDFFSLVAFLIVAFLTSHLMARIDSQRRAAEVREAHTAAIYEFSREIADAVGLDKVLEVITRRVARFFETRAAVLMLDGPTLRVRASYPVGTRVPESEIAAAEWAWTSGSPAAVTSEAGDQSHWLAFSLATGHGEAAVLALERAPGDPQLGTEHTRLLDAIVRQAAVSIERCNVDPVIDQKVVVEQIIEASENGLVVLDSSGEVIHANTVACLIFGLERSLVIGRRLEDLAPNKTQHAPLAAAVRRFLIDPSTPSEKVELKVFVRGRDHSYMVSFAPFHTVTDPRPTAILSFQDVTYVRDQELRREVLVATLSHELRTPLTSLKMAVERLKRASSNGGPLSVEIVDTAHEDVLRLEEVAQHFLDLARARAVVARIEPRPVDVNELIQRSVRLVSLQARDKGLTVDAQHARVPMISGDEVKLTWALSNLLTNAIRHTPSGGAVKVSAEDAPCGVAISVDDTGPGISPDEQDRIFEPFSQSTAAGDVGAAGLGLAIVRDIVQMHGGRIRLSSEPGHGTHFVLELPRD